MSDQQLGAAKAVLEGLEQELAGYVDHYAGNTTTLTELTAAAARVVGARKVIEAFESVE